ncbi:hypothetical protein AX774_g6458 [Zancudomyces culisetae]|uniref:Uncharacterized protein n=1 Tax=Zancudomyces culisetae TaxID=1213189 RepID=A0A1R1PGK9_ZANCU|nr:hypothetical protein AX774_g6458 [Zancudomyces culisetae]|eukprot:OMH80110.1 hypothetical protein AX774_g6458 [Zancudomyces culisetae]
MYIYATLHSLEAVVPILAPLSSLCISLSRSSLSFLNTTTTFSASPSTSLFTTSTISLSVAPPLSSSLLSISLTLLSTLALSHRPSLASSPVSSILPSCPLSHPVSLSSGTSPCLPTTVSLSHPSDPLLFTLFLGISSTSALIGIHVGSILSLFTFSLSIFSTFCLKKSSL